jgi:predicted ATPase
MIKSIKINNFFSFINSQFVPHQKETILAGINGSGKSNLIKAIKLLKKGVAGLGFKHILIDVWGGFDNIYHSGNHLNNEIVLEYEFDFEQLKKYGFPFGNNVFYKIIIKRLPATVNYQLEEYIYRIEKNNEPFVYLKFENGKGFITEQTGNIKSVSYLFDGQESALRFVSDPDRYFALYTLKKAIEDWAIYDYFDTSVQSKIRKPVLPTSERKLQPEGNNLPQILNTIKINDKQSFQKIIELLNHVNPLYMGIDFNHIGINIELMLEEKKLNKSIHVTHISDGTLRFLCLLSILYNKNRGGLLCIDEPEVGLHPDMISTIADGIKYASKDTQIIIATHSEHVLNAFDLENVRVFEKKEDNSSEVNSFSKQQFEGWYDQFMVGKMWRQNDLGGNRW